MDDRSAAFWNNSVHADQATNEIFLRHLIAHYKGLGKLPWEMTGADGTIEANIVRFLIDSDKDGHVSQREYADFLARFGGVDTFLTTLRQNFFTKEGGLQPWFHGPLSREGAAAVLTKAGDFLVRYSGSKPTDFVLQYVKAHQGKVVVKNVLVTREGTGWVLEDGTKYKSLEALVVDRMGQESVDNAPVSEMSKLMAQAAYTPEDMKALQRDFDTQHLGSYHPCRPDFCLTHHKECFCLEVKRSICETKHWTCCDNKTPDSRFCTSSLMRAAVNPAFAVLVNGLIEGITQCNTIDPWETHLRRALERATLGGKLASWNFMLKDRRGEALLQALNDRDMFLSKQLKLAGYNRIAPLVELLIHSGVDLYTANGTFMLTDSHDKDVIAQAKDELQRFSERVQSVLQRSRLEQKHALLVLQYAGKFWPEHGPQGGTGVEGPGTRH